MDFGLVFFLLCGMIFRLRFHLWQSLAVVADLAVAVPSQAGSLSIAAAAAATAAAAAAPTRVRCPSEISLRG
jgi:hypothetical protein